MNQSLSAGMVLGRYELLLPIAQGGMATVWAARQKGSRGFQKTVAVKTMLPALSDDPQFEQMFLDEAALAARIHHPNVAEILDLGEQDDILYLVMEWVDGEALSVIYKSAKKSQAHLPQRIALRIIAQACAGLHAAHELRDESEQYLDLVHRDVSPQNILVTYDGIVKIVDFGVAKAIGRAGGETTAGQLKGKVPYMSPEQARGGKVDRRTDVFAMGIVLYKLATGLHPFLGDNDMVTMKNIISRPVLSPRHKNPDFSPELEQVLLTCLQKDPAQRFQTIADLDRAIDRVLAVTGASVVDDDVGAFVRAVMGDRGPKRRAALRDAVRAADERAAGIAMTPSTVPTVHEAISDVLITRMASGLKDEMMPDRPSLPGHGGVDAQPVSSTLAAVSSHQLPLGSGAFTRRPAVLVGLGGGAVALLAGTILLLRAGLGGSEPAVTPGADQAASPVPGAEATSAPAARPAEVVVPASTTDKPAADDGAVDIEEPPSTDKPRARRAGAASSSAAPAPAAPPAETAKAEAPKPRPSKAWVPSVKDPGF